MLAYVAQRAELQLDSIKKVCKTKKSEKAIDRLREVYDRLNVI